MNVWEAITGRYKYLPEVTPDEIETLRAINHPFVPRVDNKLALDLMNKGLLKLARSGYALTGKGMSVLAAKRSAAGPSKSA